MRSNHLFSGLRVFCCLLVIFTLEPAKAAGNLGDKDTIDLQKDESLLSKADSCFQSKDHECVVTLLEQAKKQQVNRTKADQIDLLNTLADSYYELARFGLAKNHYLEALSLAQESNDLSGIGRAQRGLAHIFWRYGDFVASSAAILEGISVAEKLKDTVLLVTSYNILAGIYLENEKLEEASEIYEQMLLLGVLKKDSSLIAANLEYKGVVNFYLGSFDSAIYYYNLSKIINEKIQNPVAAGINHANMGEAYAYLGKHQDALREYLAAIEVLEKYGADSPLLFTYFSVADTYSHLGQYVQAMRYFQLSLDLMEKTGEKRELHVVYHLMAENFARQNRMTEAYAYQKKHLVTKDSIFSVQKDKQLQEVRAKYEADLKDQENLLLGQELHYQQSELKLKKKQVSMLTFLGVFLILLLVTAIILSLKLQQNRRRLARANATKDQLFSIIAHDLRGPVGNIKSLSELLDQGLDEEEKKKFVQLIKSTSTTVFTLVKDLLSWSFTQRGGFDLKPEKLNLAQTVDKCIELLAYQAESKNIIIKNTIPKELSILADENALSIICRNLFSNAIKFSKVGGEVVFSAREIMEANIPYIQLKVSDEGIGMSSQQIDRLMQGMQTKSELGTLSEEGTGLGFSLLYSFVKLMKGYILIESQENIGTAVEIRFPV